ncbi:MAG: hypothetical protein H7239_01550 [Flavobacterium sp.]|nr:hypothetical protein [Flavobacterium sp.]
MKKYIYIIIACFFLIFSFISCSEIVMEKEITDKTVILVSPTNNAQFFSTGVTFSWESVENATKYNLQIAKPTFLSPLQIVLDTTVTSKSFTLQLPIGNYEWRVRAASESYNTAYTNRLFSVVSNTDFQSNTVTLNAPTNNLITNTANQSLSWQSIIGATAYQVQVYSDSNTLLVDQTTANTTYNYTFPEGNYQWRVRASNGTDYTLYSSRSVLVDLTPPNIPVLTSPANMGTSTSSATFEWSRNAISGSTEKDTIYIYTNSTLTNLYSENQATSPYTSTLTPGTYYWKVVSSDSAGNSGNASLVYSFTVN